MNSAIRDRIVFSVLGLVLGASAVLGVGALVQDRGERDACAKLADLAAAVDSPEFLMSTDTHLLDDCINE